MTQVFKTRRVAILLQLAFVAILLAGRVAPNVADISVMSSDAPVIVSGSAGELAPSLKSYMCFI
jgi:hypothetical protein